MISAATKNRLSVVSWALQIMTGGLFLFAGASKLLGAPDMVSFFDQVGWGQWIRYAFGVLEVGSSVALFLPRYAFYGALVLSTSLMGHIIVHVLVLRRSPAFLAVLLAVTLLIAAFRRPPEVPR